MSIKELDKKYVADTYARFPIEIVKGEGSKLYDDTGKEYIDMGTGIGVNIFGVGDEEWVSAVTNQLNTLQHTSNLYYTEPCANLAQLLCEKTGAQKVFFSNSGAEANECAIKCARKYAAEKKGAEYFNIITLNNSFHGRTVTTLAATGQESFHKDFLPLTEGFLYADAGDFDGVKSLVESNKVAAIMIEVVQGEGGVVPLDKEFVKNIAELCEKEEEKQSLIAQSEALNNHPAMVGYGKYLKGLKYLAGMDKELDPDVKAFFRNELREDLPGKDTDYERYRIGEQEYIRQTKIELANLLKDIGPEKEAYEKNSSRRCRITHRCSCYFKLSNGKTY